MNSIQLVNSKKDIELHSGAKESQKPVMVLEKLD